jgi:hypothetical protein
LALKKAENNVSNVTCFAMRVRVLKPWTLIKFISNQPGPWDRIKHCQPSYDGEEEGERIEAIHMRFLRTLLGVTV